MKPLHRTRLLVVAWYSLLVAGITGAWWARPGYVWLLDSVWGPQARIHWGLGEAGLIWQIITVGLSRLLSAPVAEKLVLSLILLAIGLGGYYLARRLLPAGWALAAGTLYLLNPFVYERLLGGQWIVLAGYAFLPVLLALGWEVLQSHGQRGAYRLLAALAMFPLVSQHYAYIGLWLLAALVAVYARIEHPRWLLTARTARWFGGTLVATAAANAFWLLGGKASDYQAFGTGDFAVFRTATDAQFGVWANVLSLYGFWRGSAYIEPKTWLSWWWLVALIVFALAALGAVRAARTRNYLAVTLALSLPLAAALAIGYASPALRPLIDALIQYLPGFTGLRDTSKLVGVVALVYAILAPWAAAWLAKRYLPHRRLFQWSAPATVVLLAALSVTGIWNGFGGQVAVSTYPAGWQAAEERLAATPGATALVLPWHGYLRLDFAGGTYAAQPARVFFSSPTLVAQGIDNPFDPRGQTPLDESVLGLLTGAEPQASWIRSVKAAGATHVVLLKTDDWPPYAQALTGLTVEFDDPTITLYKLP